MPVQMPGRLAAVEAPQAPGSSRQMPPVPLRIGDLIASESDARLIRQWMMDPTTGPFPAGGSLFGRCSGGQESTPARSCSSGSAGEDGAEQYSPGPSLGAWLAWLLPMVVPCLADTPSYAQLALSDVVIVTGPAAWSC